MSALADLGYIMKKTIIKVTVFILTFFISLFTIGRIMNKGNHNLTMEMAGATFPVITMVKDGIAYNQLHGYQNAMDVAFQRETVTELEPNREVAFTVEPYGTTVTGITVEVRSTDGGRLIESSPVTDIEMQVGRIDARIVLKDLIEADNEYALVILLETQENGIIRFYTRVVWSENTHAAEKLQFIIDFHQTLYDKEAARELTKYLESNSQGDNSTLHKVNIHSSFKQVTWGELPVTEQTKPNVRLTELASQTASVILDYIVSTPEGKQTVYYTVEEYFRIRYTTDRIYLLDYERTMTQIPDVNGNIYANDKILLGIVDENIPFMESEDGNIILFQVANRLCSYNVTTNKLTVLFSFYDKENADSRTMYSQHDMKILDVDEGGNVRFAVYGYMNRGRHEGEVGIEFYYYDSALNTVEEAIYIPYSKTYAVLAQEMEQLLYMNRENQVYLFLENTVYGIDLMKKNYEKVVTITQDDSMQVSENHKILVWQEGVDINHSSRLNIRNLSNGRQTVIDADEGDAVRPLGFMDEDIIYGVARQEDIVIENTGRVIFPMYKICIQNSDGELLKEYGEENVFIVGCTVMDNQIALDQVRRSENGAFQEAEPYYITNNVEAAKGKNILATAVIDIYQKYVQIQTSKTIDTKTLKVLTPKEVVFEGGRDLSLEAKSESPRYYVYGAYGVDGIFNAPAQAINLAYANAGVVINDKGNCIWLKGNRVLRNQIMAIQEEDMAEGQTSLAVCLDTILKFEGIMRNSQNLLNQGQNVIEILQDGLESAQILDLTGCTLDAVLYYVNQDIPVLATLENGEAVLITGFNEFNIVIMEPSKGAPYKRGIKDSTEWFAENGNSFVTYIRN